MSFNSSKVRLLGNHISYHFIASFVSIPLRCDYQCNAINNCNHTFYVSIPLRCDYQRKRQSIRPGCYMVSIPLRCDYQRITIMAGRPCFQVSIPLRCDYQPFIRQKTTAVYQLFWFGKCNYFFIKSCRCLIIVFT